jgi:hypothetical protein
MTESMRKKGCCAGEATQALRPCKTLRGPKSLGLDEAYTVGVGPT